MQIKGFSPVERDLIRERTGEGHCYETPPRSECSNDAEKSSVCCSRPRLGLHPLAWSARRRILARFRRRRAGVTSDPREALPAPMKLLNPPAE
jgi:hypothetical protein